MGRNRNENEHPSSGNSVLTLRLQPIYDIAEICAQKGLAEAVLCPGSRCAPLTTAFTTHPSIKTRTFSDERSAAFIANGIAIANTKPVVLICTSGSAAYNFSPGVAEAFFQQIPLLILTADRPKEWIDQLDGQTIHQTNLYGNHVKETFELPLEYEHPDAKWHINRIVNEAINLSNQHPKGPVHINIPLREPLYPADGETIQFTNEIRIIDERQVEAELPTETLAELEASFTSFNKVLIIVGQDSLNNHLTVELDKFSKQHHVPIVADIISNQHNIFNCVSHSDVMLGQCKSEVKKALRPELLISMGRSVISKNLKLFLRQYKASKHWHIQCDGYVSDTFQSLTSIIPVSPIQFFRRLGPAVSKAGFEAQKRENYYRLWEAEEHRTQRSVTSFFSTPQLNEFSLVSEILKNLPEECNLHLANSMPVRYTNFIGLKETNKGVEVFCNRGTSGIDGCSSTAVGHSLATEKPTVLITGDMALFYDRNAFWHNYKLPNLRIVVLNNHGGAIFSIIDGPSLLPEVDEYFVTQQKLTARSLALEYDFDYLKLDNLKKMKNLLKDFFDFDGRTKILEIESTAARAKETVEEFTKQIRENYDA